MAEEFVRLVKIGIDKGFIQDSIANADRLSKSIDELKETKKQEGKLSAEQEGKLKALTAERNKNIQVVKQANLLTSKNIKGQEKLKAQLSIVTAQFNKLTTEEQNNTKQGKRLQKQVLDITNELKANEKAVGNNRRNVGNYEEALQGVAGQLNVMGVNLGGLATQLKTYKDGVVASAAATKASATATGGLSGALQILKVALISTGIGAIVVALGSMVTFLTQTKRGSELLAQGLSAIGATVSVLIDRMSMLGEGLVKVFQLDFAGAAEVTKGALSGVTEEIVKESKAAKDLEKRMQKLRDAERELLVETSKRKAEVAELQLIAEDETKTYKERGDAIQKANAIQEANLNAELELQKEKVAIIKAQMELSENLEEDEQRLAEETARLGEIEAANIKKLRTLKAKENSIRNQEAAAERKRQSDQIKQQQELTKAQEKAEQERIKAAKEREKAIEQGYIDERALIDQQAEVQKAQAEIEIANAEERAERIAFIEREALQAKLNSLDDETAAYTASADMVGAIDEKKYAKQIAQIKKLEAEKAAMDRAAKADELNREMELLGTREELANQQADIEIANTEERESAKQKIALKYLNERLALMEKSAMLDDVLTEQEKANLQKVRNEIKLLQQTISSPDNKTIADMIGLSDEDLEKMFVAMEVVNGLLQAAQQATQQSTENKLNQIDQELQAEVSAINSSTKSEEEKEKAITKAEQKAAKERYRIEVEQFKTAKALQIALAVANTATAVMAQLSNPTPYVGFVLAALAAATGAVQIATISSQKPPPPPAFATGGKVLGAGTGTSDSIPARLSNGEAVINAKSTSMFEPILSAMNAAGGGVDWYRGEGFSKGGLVQKFAAGGVAVASGAMMRENEATREIQQTIINTPPVLVIEEFQNVQGRQIRTEQNLQV